MVKMLNNVYLLFSSLTSSITSLIALVTLMVTIMLPETVLLSCIPNGRNLKSPPNGILIVPSSYSAIPLKCPTLAQNKINNSLKRKMLQWSFGQGLVENVKF